jgi:hypothetical protein
MLSVYSYYIQISAIKNLIKYEKNSYLCNLKEHFSTKYIDKLKELKTNNSIVNVEFGVFIDNYNKLQGNALLSDIVFTYTIDYYTIHFNFIDTTISEDSIIAIEHYNSPTCKTHYINVFDSNFFNKLKYDGSHNNRIVKLF